MNEFYDVVDSEGTVLETALEQMEQAVEDGAPQIVMDSIPLKREQEPPSEGQLKLLRKQYITVSLPKVVGCKHRLDLSKQPTHRNCESCWFAFFQNHGELTQQCDEMFQADGGVLMTQLQGKKFTRRFLQFMSTVAQWKVAESAAKEKGE